MNLFIKITNPRFLSIRLLFMFVFSFIHTTVHAGVLLQGFYWDAPSPSTDTWWDKLSQDAQFLSESGFTAIWIPPVLKGASGGYSNGYDPFDDYDLGSKDQRSTYGTHWGTREQLTRMIAMMRANGLDVYFDNVLGHRSGDDGNSNFIYKNSYGQEGQGRFPKSHFDFSGYNSFGRQLNYFNPYTRDNLTAACQWLIEALGVQGMRIDMATNVHPDFLNSYLNTGVMSSQFVVSEYWSENLNELENYVINQMNGRVHAFDFPLWGRLKDMTNANGYYDLRQLITAGLNSRQPRHSVTFVENHDTDRGFPTTQNKHLAYAYILTTEGYPSVFWKDYFQYGLKRILDPLIWIHEKMAHGSLIWRHTDEDLLIFERQNHRGLLVGLNDNQINDKSMWVQTQFGPFVTLHDYTGHASDIKTEADGRVQITVPKNSYVAYSASGFHEPHQVQSHRTNQQFAGAMDLDIPPLTMEFQSIGRIFVESNSEVFLSLYTDYIEKKSVDSLSLEKSDFVEIQIFKEHQNQPFLIESIDLNSPTQQNSFKLPSKGWYEFKLRHTSKQLNRNKETLNFWLNVNYLAPKTL